MKTKQIIYYSLALLTVLSAAIYLSSCRNKPDNNIGQEKTLKISLTAPLSGDFAYYGTEVKNALQEAIKDYHGPIKIDFSFDNNSGDPKQVVSSYDKLKDSYNPAVVVSTNSPLSAPLKSLAEEDQTILLALVTGSTDFAKDYKYVFRDAITSDFQGKFIAEQMLLAGYKKIAIMVVNDAKIPF